MAAEGVLGAISSALITKFRSPEILSFSKRREGDAALLEKMEINFLIISELVNDVEERPVEKSVKHWVKKLRDLMYDMEDLLDEMATETMLRELEADQSQPPKGRVRKLLFASKTSFEPHGKGMRSKIKDILVLMDILKSEAALFGFNAPPRVSEVKSSGVSRSEKLITTSLVSDLDVYGRENDKAKIISLLLSDEASDNDEMPVIALVGMGGLGKTTLAQLVYNDQRVHNHFDLKAWVCVSEVFDIYRVTKTILEAVTSDISESRELDLLQSRLAQILAGKRFLLVLDDVWNEDYNKWQLLQAPLRSGAQGSKIVVTTRSQSVALIMSTAPSYLLKLLADEDCWLLFAEHAFGHVDPISHPDLEEVGMKIAIKCRGLPLAAKALGGLLRHKPKVEYWLSVLNSQWEMEHGGDVLSVLRLSYYHLPANLKRCFAYCSLFPLNYGFGRKELVLLWMAEGFLEQSSGTMEEVGDAYFQELLWRSFIQQSAGSDSRFEMHDLMNDLARYVSEGHVVRFGDMETSQILSEGTRHLSYARGKSDTSEKFGVICRAKRLSTFFSMNSNLDSESCQLSVHVLNDLFERLQRLRVLSLTHYQITALPDSIGNLKHLRYLDLSYNALERLPESVCSLCHLLTLVLRNCCSLAIWPRNFGNLINLRYLDISGAGVREMPEHMSRLKNLQTLTNFIVGHTGSRIRELGSLLHLHGKLSVSELQNVSTLTDAQDANLKAKKKLSELQLVWSSDNKFPQTERVVLENLEPSTELRKLTIEFYGGTVFPDWLGDSSFSKIVFLCLSDCHNCSSLPPLGDLPSLEDLILERVSGVSSVGHEFYQKDSSSSKPFQSLKTLKFMEMSEWEQWLSLEVEGEEFPCLRLLYIQKCPKLQGVYFRRFPSLMKLVISECQQLEVFLPRIPDACEVLLEHSDKVTMHDRMLLRFDCKLSMGGDDESVSQFSAHMTEMSNLTYEAASASSSGKPTYEATSKSFPQRSGISDISHEADNQMKTLSSQDRVKLFSSSGYMKVSDTARLRELPPGLQSLRIEGCDTLESLSMEIMDTIPFLQHLYIIDCCYLKLLPRGHQITSLKTLYIRNCRKLELLQPAEMMYQFALLEHLCLGSSCDALKSFPLNSFRKLRILSLWDCANLEYLSMEKGLQKDLASLDALEIRDCPSLEFFPKEGLPAPNLTSIFLSNCKNLRLLPRWMPSLRTLKSLYINECPELDSIPIGGLPLSLNLLCITFCDKITPQREWRLDRLASLSHFEIEGGGKDLDSFPEEGLLPSNLNSLRISRLTNLKSLDQEGLQQLTSLETLEIDGCKRLRSFPEEGLPASLSFLSIKECSLLKAKLQNMKGKEWSKISHIPHIHIDEEELHEQD